MLNYEKSDFRKENVLLEPIQQSSFSTLLVLNLCGIQDLWNFKGTTVEPEWPCKL